MEDKIDKVMTMLVHGLISFIIPSCRRSDSTGKRRCSDGSRGGGRGPYLDLWPNCSLFQDPSPCSEHLERARPQPR